MAENLPPPLFAFFIGDGHKVTLVKHVNQRPADTKAN